MTVLVPLAPCMMLRLLGDAETEKLEFTDTLSKVAVARAELLLLLTARPISTFAPILMVWFEPTWVQFTPSGEE